MKSDNVDAFEGGADMRAERCVCCGAVIPEGMQVCPKCCAAANDGRSESQERIPGRKIRRTKKDRRNKR